MIVFEIQFDSNYLVFVPFSAILFFLAIYYYMAVVQLPAKADYWTRSKDGVIRYIG